MSYFCQLLFLNLAAKVQCKETEYSSLYSCHCLFFFSFFFFCGKYQSISASYVERYLQVTICRPRLRGALCLIVVPRCIYYIEGPLVPLALSPLLEMAALGSECDFPRSVFASTLVSHGSFLAVCLSSGKRLPTFLPFLCSVHRGKYLSRAETSLLLFSILIHLQLPFTVRTDSYNTA